MIRTQRNRIVLPWILLLIAVSMSSACIKDEPAAKDPPALTSAGATSQGEEHNRVWTNAVGEEIANAAVVGYSAGRVDLQPVGELSGPGLRVPMKDLSAADQEYIRSKMGIQVFECDVVHVFDGDSFKVRDSNQQSFEVRLEGIDAPERGQDFAEVAKLSLSEKVLDKTVRVEFKTRDQYGRVLGHVWSGDKYLNMELIEEGLAWHFKKYSNASLAQAESRARNASLGLWSIKSPVPPWEYRRYSPPASR